MNKIFTSLSIVAIFDLSQYSRFRAVLSQLHELLASDRSPVCASRPPCVLDDAIQTPLTHFSVVSFSCVRVCVCLCKYSSIWFKENFLKFSAWC